MMNDQECFELYTAMTRREVLNTPEIDCDYCRNANTCDELSHTNDLSYKSCGIVDEKTRMFFKTGDNRVTQIIVEHETNFGVDIIAHFIPKYCPFCGRELVENKRHFIAKKEK